MRSFRQSLSASAIVALTLAAAGCSSPEERRESNPYPPLTTGLDDFCRAPKDGVYAVSASPVHNLVIADKQGVRLAYWDGKKISPKEHQSVFFPNLPDAEALQALANGVSEAEIIRKFGPPHLIQTCDQMTMIYPFGGLAQTHYPDEKRAEYRFFTAGPHGEMSELTLHVMYPIKSYVNKTCRVEWMISGHKVATESTRAKGR